MSIELKSNAPSGPIETAWSRHKFDIKVVNPANKRKYTVIVVGTGLAGASAAASPKSPDAVSNAAMMRLRLRVDIIAFEPVGMEAF